MSSLHLSPKHQQFINEYIDCFFNGTEAYRRVYPDCTYDAARVNASKLLTNPNIKGQIERRIADNAMSANEVLARLAEHGRGDLGDYMGKSIDDIKATKKTRLLKKTIVTRTMSVSKNGTMTESESITLEMYSAQSALKLLGEHHGLFDDTAPDDDNDNLSSDWWAAAE